MEMYTNPSDVELESSDPFNLNQQEPEKFYVIEWRWEGKKVNCCIIIDGDFVLVGFESEEGAMAYAKGLDEGKVVLLTKELRETLRKSPAYLTNDCSKVKQVKSVGLFNNRLELLNSFPL